MAQPTVVLITGVSRGIGNGLLRYYLALPSHIVIGSVRDTTATEAQALLQISPGPGSYLQLVSIEAASFSDPSKAVDRIRDLGISHLDIVIANAGICLPHFSPDLVPIQDAISSFHINTAGPLALWQAMRPLLKESTIGPKWISISSGAGSIGGISRSVRGLTTSYGMSKAAMNYFTKSVAEFEKNWLTVLAINPGLVETDMGTEGARSLGLLHATISIDESVAALVQQIDKVTLETSGFFINASDGQTLPW